DISAAKGIAIFMATLPVSVTTLVSGIYQGLTAASGVLLVAKKPEEAGKAFVLPALVETYAIFALVITILFLSALR
ncbi:MAG: permease, partial [Actinobacteria bacterium]